MTVIPYVLMEDTVLERAALRLISDRFNIDLGTAHKKLRSNGEVEYCQST
jgi:hypothetical protein